MIPGPDYHASIRVRHGACERRVAVGEAVIDVVPHDEDGVEHEAVVSARAEEDHRPEREVAKLRGPPPPADHPILLAAGVVELVAEDERIGILNPSRRVDRLPEGILEPARVLGPRVAVRVDDP